MTQDEEDQVDVDEEEYQAEVLAITAGFLEVAAGHEHQKVLHALGGFMVECLHEEYFDESLSVDFRIHSLMRVMTGLVRMMAERSVEEGELS